MTETRDPYEADGLPPLTTGHPPPTRVGLPPESDFARVIRGELPLAPGTRDYLRGTDAGPESSARSAPVVPVAGWWWRLWARFWRGQRAPSVREQIAKLLARQVRDQGRLVVLELGLGRPDGHGGFRYPLGLTENFDRMVERLEKCEQSAREQAKSSRLSDEQIRGDLDILKQEFRGALETLRSMPDPSTVESRYKQLVLDLRTQHKARLDAQIDEIRRLRVQVDGMLESIRPKRRAPAKRKR